MSRTGKKQLNSATRLHPQEALRPFVRFVHVLRGLGVRVSVAETLDALNALAHIDLLDRQQTKVALASTLVKNSQDRRAFEAAFETFFAPPDSDGERSSPPKNPPSSPACPAKNKEGVDGDAGGEREGYGTKGEERDWGKEILDLLAQTVEKNERLSIKPGWIKRQLADQGSLSSQPGKEGPLLPQARAASHSAAAWLRQAIKQSGKKKRPLLAPAGAAGSGEDELIGAVTQRILEEGSGEEDLLYENMKNIAAEDLPRVTVLLKRLSRHLATRISRRYTRQHQKVKLDIRRTIRVNTSYGGVLLKLKYQARRTQKPRLVLICDVSGSMSYYAVFAILFVYGLASVVKNIESFIFAENLERVTPHLKKGNSFVQTMSVLVDKCSQWGGGTNLAAALSEFLKEYRRLLTPATTVILVSDAQTILPEKAVNYLKEMRSLTKDIVWLNPLPQEEWKFSPAIFNFMKHSRMYECSTIDQLNRIITRQMLPQTR